MKWLATLMVLCLVLISSVNAYAQIHDWGWAKAGGGFGTDYAEAHVTDNLGNTYVTGSFSGTAQFGQTTLISSGGEDIVIAKLDSSGNWVWAVQAGGNDFDTGLRIYLDTQGNVYFIGVFTSVANFGTIQMTSMGHYDIFVAKISSNGSWDWVAQAGGTGFDKASDIHIGSDGSIYVSGGFEANAYFGDNLLVSNGLSDIFIAKINAEGCWVWAKSTGGVGTDHCYPVSTDANHNVILAGQYYSSIQVGNHVLTSTGDSDTFVAKLDSNGNWLWANTAGGEYSIDRATGLAIDSQGSIYIIGRFSDSATFGHITLPGYGNFDIYVAKLSNNGTWLWAVQAGGYGDDTGYAITVGSDDSIYITGLFRSQGYFGNTSLSSLGMSDIFVSALNSNGNWLWTMQGGGSANDYSRYISTDANGGIWISGYITGTANFGNAIAHSSGDMDLMVAYLRPEVNMPIANPSAGAYASNVEVTLSCPMPGASVYYTLDPELPSDAWIEYTSPIQITESCTLKAIARHADYPESNVFTAFYQIVPPVAELVISPLGGIYSSAIMVSLSSPNPGAQIRYTIDGTEPTSNSTLYTQPIYVEYSTTVKAKAYANGMNPSNLVTATYNITGTVANPIVSPPGGTYTTAQYVVLSCSTPYTELRYTLNGTDPLSNSTIYSSPILIANSAVLKVRGYAQGWTPSAVTTTTYNITGTVSTPAFSLPSGIYTNSLNIAISCNNVGASIRYTVDGTEPNSSSAIYTQPIVVETSTITIKAKAYLPGWEPSTIAAATYTVTGTVATPVFSPPSGLLQANQAISLSCNTLDAQIRYTLDGTNPNIGSTLYTEPIMLESSATIKAVAYLQDWVPSAMAIASYQLPVSNTDEYLGADDVVSVYPNPFRDSATIAISTKEANSNYQVNVYNLKGECVYSCAGVANGKLHLTWNGCDNNKQRVASGLYIIKVVAGKQSITRRLVLL